MNESLRSNEGYRDKTETAPSEGRMVINPQGARIERLTLDQRLILRSVVRGDGSQASSHPCTPIFGPEITTNFGLPARHGTMRDALCTVEESGPNLVILNHEIQSGNYPPGMNVRQSFAMFGGSFALETAHANKGEQAAPVNFGEHFYWDAPRGWEGLRINGDDVGDAVKNDLVIPLQATNQILIPGMGEIILAQRGLPFANLWVFKDETTGNYDKDYVCIEPIEGDPARNFFGSPESMISPGASRKTIITIKV